VTGGGHGKTFADVRDYALIRVLTDGLRRTEVTEMRMTDLPLDLVGQRLIRVVPLKGALAGEEGRVVPVAAATARSIAAYLGVRRYHRLADSPFVWLGLRNGGPLDGTPVPDAAPEGRAGRLRACGAPAHVPAYLRQRLANGQSCI
jgi:integrase